MPLFYIIRHGQASFGEENYDKLSDKGIEQSEVLGEFFQRCKISFDKICSGTLSRQQDTAIHCLNKMGKKDINLSFYEGLNEYDHLLLINSAIEHIKKTGSSEVPDLMELSKDKKRFQAFFSNLVEKWISGEFLQGDDSYSSYSERVLSAVEKMSDTDTSKQKIAVFTSGGPISVLIEKSLGISSYRAVETGWTIANCSVSVFSTNGKLNKDKDGLRLRSFNSTAHFELINKDLITYR